MIVRKKFRARVILANQFGATEEVVQESYWSPSKDFVTTHTLGVTAAAENGSVQYPKTPVSVERL